MTIGDRIRLRREALKMSQEALAEKLGYKSRSSINKIELGQQNLTQSKIAAIAAALETTPSYIMGWKEEETDPVSLLHGFPVGKQGVRPIYGTVSAGLGQYVEGDDFLGFETVDKQYDTDAYFYLRVKGDSMAPIIGDGDLLLIRKQEIVDSGEIAVLLVDGEEGYVKKIEYGNGYIDLISINPYYPPLHFHDAAVSRVRIVGKVVEMKRKF